MLQSYACENHSVANSSSKYASEILEDDVVVHKTIWTRFSCIWYGAEVHQYSGGLPHECGINAWRSRQKFGMISCLDGLMPNCYFKKDPQIQVRSREWRCVSRIMFWWYQADMVYQMRAARCGLDLLTWTLEEGHQRRTQRLTRTFSEGPLTSSWCRDVCWSAKSPQRQPLKAKRTTE